jgi:hypothetical protein
MSLNSFFTIEFYCQGHVHIQANNNIGYTSMFVTMTSSPTWSCTKEEGMGSKVGQI